MVSVYNFCVVMTQLYCLEMTTISSFPSLLTMLWTSKEPLLKGFILASISFCLNSSFDTVHVITKTCSTDYNFCFIVFTVIGDWIKWIVSGFKLLLGLMMRSKKTVLPFAVSTIGFNESGDGIYQCLKTQQKINNL